MGVREELLDEKGKIDLRRAGLPPTVMAYTMHWAMRWASLAILWLRPRCASAACAS